MTLQTFLRLDYTGRLQAVKEAVCIAGRDIAKFKVLLFQLENFYVEVFYHTKYSYVTDLVAFDDTERLEPYLQKIQVDLAHLIKS